MEIIDVDGRGLVPQKGDLRPGVEIGCARLSPVARRSGRVAEGGALL